MRSNGTAKKIGSKSVIYSLAALAVCALQADGVSRAYADKKSDEGLGINLAFEQKTLSNGLGVILVEDRTVPIVSYQTWFRVGSVDEKPGQTGIAHLFEHLMFKGTPKFGPKQFFIQLEAKGAEVNAFTTRDYTAYFENITPDLLDKVIEMESDRMSNLKLDDDVLNTERMVVLEERRMRTDNSPGGRVQEELWGLSFKRHPYRWPVIGFPADLFRLKTSDLVEFYKKHYQPKNALLVVVGNFDSKVVFEKIKAAYGGIEGVKRPERKVSNESEQNEERRLRIYDDIASERFAHAYRVTSAKDDDSYSLDVLANILFEGDSSRAYRSLIDVQDIAIGIGGSAYTPTYPGLFIVTGTMKGSLSSELAEKALDQVIKKVQDEGVTAEEVKVAVKQLTVQLVDSVRTPQGMAQLIGVVHATFGTIKDISENLAKYQKITPADVQRVARKYMIPNNRAIVTLLPEPKTPEKKKGKSTATTEASR